ncbi:tripartite tricarboxylate transporter substrate-binding protein [Agrococcus jejuensis]|uniref:Tripartite-type tricarboxylate transporter, receptor component TctC n=1 Tax=Agrococcus jejuensis TaxID=399736 RepID=A0A1G8E002_9MICO|nr:tripartite tricarboxylate transporter substrate-binding protein [Agrococcus jejuensis]SDH63070.1 Tripartite-type tricarboxylate transporter, receptor component TctC [Agrococcus jejuensis]
MRATHTTATRRSSIAALAVLPLLALAGCSGGSDAAYPDDTIEIVVPFAAGGPTDTVTRIVADPMGEELGAQVVVQNVEGAGGTVAAGEVAAADPDGYTVLMHHIGMSTAPALYDDLNFDPVEDFAPVGLVTEVPMTIVSRSGLGPSNLEDLVAYLEDERESVTIAHAGVGSASNLCARLLQDAVGVELTEVPYDGTGPAMADLLGGQVDLLCDQTTNTAGQILGGEVDAYAVTTPERVEVLPDVPTTAEAGLPDLEIGVWHALYVPAGTPDEVIAALETALQTALADPAVVDQMAELGIAPVSAADATPEALAERLSEQIALWDDVLSEPGR